MNIVWKIGIGILAVFIVIQFIRPARNQSGQVLRTDIVNTVAVPLNVQQALRKACYDCHSNMTSYKWFDEIQPAAWLVRNHIDHAKENLNFNEFGSYSIRKQINKLKAINNSVEDGSMPIASYTIIHRNAILSKGDKKLIMDWMKKTIDSLSSNE